MKYVETIKIVDGEVMNYAYHRQRAFNTNGAILPHFITVPDEYKKGMVKCRVVYDSIVHYIEFIPYTFPTIHSLQTVDVPHYFYENKYTDRQELQRLFAKRGICDDVLIAVNGKIADTSFCNVVFENNEGLFTPQRPLLKGVKRAVLLDKNIITTRDISIDQIGEYDRLHLINAMIDLGNPSTIVDVNKIISFEFRKLV